MDGWFTKLQVCFFFDPSFFFPSCNFFMDLFCLNEIQNTHGNTCYSSSNSGARRNFCT